MLKFFKKKSDVQKLIERVGLEDASFYYAGVVAEKLPNNAIFKQFLLEELDGASQGNAFAQEFARNSPIPESEYKGALRCSSPEVDGPNGPQQTLHRITLQLSHDRELMAKFRVMIVSNIIHNMRVGTPDNPAEPGSLERPQFIVGDESLPTAPKDDDEMYPLCIKIAQSLTKRLLNEQDIYWFVVEQYDRLLPEGENVQEILSNAYLFNIEHRGSRSESSYVGKPNPGVTFLDQKVMPPLEDEYGRETAQRLRATIYVIFCSGFEEDIRRLRIKYAVHYANNCSSAGHHNRVEEWDEVIAALEAGD